MSYLIPGLSDHTFWDVSYLLLAHPSILKSYHAPFLYAGRYLWPGELFINPGVWGTEHWERGKQILVKCGHAIMVDPRKDVYSSLYWKEIEWFDEHRLDLWSMVMNELWEPGIRLRMIQEGPVELEITTLHLRDVKPYFEPSKRMAEFINDLTGVDYTNAAVVAKSAIESYIQPVETYFPRIRHRDDMTIITLE